MNDGPITERGDPRDRVANQMQLFDADRTTTATCIACGATREPNEDKAALCLYDRDSRDYGVTGRRPTKCLNAHDPVTAPFPDGF